MLVALVRRSFASLRTTIGAALLTFSLATSALAQSLTTPDPVGAGFSPARLARIAPWYQSQIDTGALPGAVVAIARDGKLAYLQAIGTYDRAGKVPLKPDAIFWIASMTKPVTSVAAMMLVDEGKLALTDPVSKYIPAVADMRVGLEAALQKRPMQVIDLLRHTSGFTYADEGADALHKAYDRIPSFRRDKTLADLTGDLVRMQLVHQPGEAWEYSHGVDVLGRLVEIASGQPLDRFFEERIFRPLGMVDTGFFVPPDKLARLVDPIARGRSRLWDVTKPTTLFMGGGGLASTAPDYLRFCQMLLNGGELDGVRILSAKTVQQMATNALSPDVHFVGEVGKYVGPQVGTSWGLGFAIRTNPDFSILPGAVGSFNWSGIWGTYFWIDPVDKLIGVLMIQVPPDAAGPYRGASRHLSYAALRVPEPVETPPAVTVSSDALKAYGGTYDFGPSLSSRDKQAPIPAFAFAGVGLEVTTVEGKVVVRIPFEGGPADRAGVKALDVVTDIDDVPVGGLPIDQVLDKLRGKAGTQVRLKIARYAEDRPIDVTIVREAIRLPGARIEVRVVDGKLMVAAIGRWAVLDFEKDKPVPVVATSDTEFRYEGGDHTRLAFVRDPAGKVSGVVLNPGPWEIKAAKID
jgi:CubicO group peptidase (beta-lactamase class C family)